MSVLQYLRDRLFLIVLMFVLMVVISIVLILFKVNSYLVGFIPILIAVTLTVYLIHDYCLRYDYYNQLNKYIKKLDKKYLVCELTKQPHFIEGEIINDAIYEICKNANEFVKASERSNSEFKEYLESWCHEIKTPVATSKLVIENNRNTITESIEEELNSIDDFVEQVLFYARSNYVEKDYIINKVSLHDCVINVIRRNKKDILVRKIKISLNNLDGIVYSDSKWLEFIINQIVNNSIKYCSNNPELIIETKENKNNIVLIIKDNGIGISDNEIKRVFDKGFTGSNGRNVNSKATGMGLYLCKQLCNRLSHGLYITSKQGVEVNIIFPKNSFYQTLQ